LQSPVQIVVVLALLPVGERFERHGTLLLSAGSQPASTRFRFLQNCTNRILRAKLPARLRLSNPKRTTLAEIGKRPGRKALREVGCVAKPDTILAWYRKLIAQKFDGSKHRQYPGRLPVSSEVEALVVRMARENSGWGYDRIVGALAKLGHRLSHQTVKNILRQHGIAPAPKRSQVTSWKDFLAAHMNVLEGCDFFTVEVLSWRGLVTYYVLFLLHLESRRST
jgi:putative transposase